ncbi:ABC transporter substrate-binding protein [Anaerosporomusa subterranea]|uniref:ABC transporter substrate-binding protein n=2 Tax=Anaerosporomusa subterranea TaxID=1794912 RepID=A0A154BNW8_ANASB|nr:ABC transporter substrate-binding protein [Anaerosporomusa subterranea]
MEGERMVSKKLIAVLVLVAFAALLTGCGATKEAPAADTKKPVKVVFWYSLAGKISETTKKMVEEFNKTHPDIQVEAIYQGSYDDSINKLKQSIQSKSAPHVIQIYDIGTRFMIDSKSVVPAQKWIDTDKIDVAKFEKNIMGYYTVDNKLYSMPFNTSTPILYYNKDAFKAAGLDPEKPPRTFEEVAEAARKLTVKEGGKVTRSGMSIAIYGWFFEQLMALQNATYANNNNGRDSLATAVTINGPEGEKILNWWNDMVKEGSAANMGRKTADTQKAFVGGQIAMTIDSTAVLGDIMNGVGGKFQVGTAFMPRPADSKGGVIIGGGSLWMLSGHSDKEEKAAWEFVKFMTSAKQQAYWHINTGYFPVTQLAYDDPDLKKHQEKYPQFKVAVDQLHATPVTRPTQGALLGVFTQARQEVEGAIERTLTGQASAKDSLTKAQDTINASIGRYNQTIK